MFKHIKGPYYVQKHRADLYHVVSLREVAVGICCDEYYFIYARSPQDAIKEAQKPGESKITRLYDSYYEAKKHLATRDIELESSLNQSARFLGFSVFQTIGDLVSSKK